MSTLRASLAKVIRSELAKLGILLVYEYRVVSQAGEAVNLQIVRKASGLPDTTRVYARPVAGHKATYAAGGLVLVAFVEGDPARPFLAFGGVVGEPGTIPRKAEVDALDEIRIGRSTTDRVIVGDAADPPKVGRVGDAVELGTLAVGGVGGVVLTFTPAGGGAPIGPLATVTLSGKIAEGSDLLRSS